MGAVFLMDGWMDGWVSGVVVCCMEAVVGGIARTLWYDVIAGWRGLEVIVVQVSKYLCWFLGFWMMRFGCGRLEPVDSMWVLACAS